MSDKVENKGNRGQCTVDTERDTSGPGLRILHCFADFGTEAEALGCYGDVVRVGLDAQDTNESQPIKADAHHIPFGEGVRFDLGLFHPPCTKWSDMPDANKNGDAPDLIPLAREIAERHCDYWVIENKPRAPLNDPVLLNGKMFGLPIEYERAFESNFQLEQPPRQAFLAETESSSYFYSEKSRGWWASVKGIDADAYTKHALCKNSLPSAYVHHIVRSFFRATGGDAGPSNYDDYDRRKTAERRRRQNQSLDQFAQIPIADGGTSCNVQAETVQENHGGQS